MKKNTLMRTVSMLLAVLMLSGLLVSCKCDHVNAAFTVTKEPTCTEAGERAKQCPDCGETLATETILPTGHHTHDHVIAPTCLEQGYTEHHCEHCGVSWIDSYVPAVGHKESVLRVEPTCTADGYAEYTCVVCGASHREAGAPALGHEYVLLLETTSCEEGTVEEYICRRCGDTYHEHTAPATGHEYTTIVVQPTCTAEGYTLYTCKHCGNEYKGDVVPAVAHEYKTVTLTDADCTHEGVLSVTCTLCGATHTEKIPALGHAGGTADCEHLAVCERCGEEYGELTGHQWTAADCESARKCAVCGLEDGEILGHVGGEATCSQKAVCERCGKEYGELAEHEWVPATCTEAEHCAHCDAERGEALGHNWLPADCTHAATCSRCRQTQGNALGHTWLPADCTHPETCSSCYVTRGVPLGHTYATVTQTDAGCESTGVLLHTCSVCSATYTDVIPAKGHVFVAATQTDADCTKTGVMLYTCTACGATYTDIIPAKGHVWEAASCLSPRTCSVCHATDGKPLGHITEIDETLCTPPTCTATGLNVYVCTRDGCTHTDMEVIPALGHKFKVVKTASASCLTGGYVTQQCTECGLTQNTGYVSPTDHHYVKSVVTPTCLEPGKEIYTCDRCGDSYDVDLPATGHTYSHIELVTPTCLEQGYTKHVCADCGASYNDTFVSPTDHVYVISVQTPTCLTPGVETHTCSLCGHSYEISLPALGHLFAETVVSPTCLESGYTLHECTREDCFASYTDTVIPATGHQWNGDVTCTQGAICTECGETIPAKGHVYQKIQTVTPTCVTAGYEVYRCVSCTDTYTVTTTDAYGHTFGTATATEILKEGTKCEYEQVYTCTVCGEKVVNGTIMHHRYVASVTAEANCVATGVKTYTCSECGDHYDEVIPIMPGAHIWNEGEKNGNVITYACTCEGCSVTKTVIDASESISATVSSTDLATGEVQLEKAAIGLDEKTQKQLSASGNDVEMSAEIVTKSDLALSEDMKAQIGDNPIFNFTVKDGEEAVTDFDGKVTVTIPYVLGKDEDVDSIAIWYINNEGIPESIPATYANGFVTFKTTHFSYYTVTRLTPAERCALYGHSDTKRIVTPTCVDQGYTLVICARCGRVEKVSYTDALGHAMIRDDDACVTPNCLESGCEVFVCAHEGCQYFEKTVLPATGHDMVRDDAACVKPTCVVNGREVYVCTHEGCEYKETGVIKAIGHYYLIVSEVTPTCLAAGSVIYRCEHCGNTYEESGDAALGHSYALDVELSVAPTCTAAGSDVYVCQDCDATYSTPVAALGHAYDSGTVTAPTCLEQGYTHHVCTREGCDASMDDTYTAALGHDMVLDDAACISATCDTAGKNVFVCSHEGCSVTDIRETPALGHEYRLAKSVSATCLESGYEVYICDRCGDSYELTGEEAKNHHYVKDEKSCVAPGCLTSGKDVFVCDVCGDSYEAVIPAHGHEYADTVVTPTCLEQGYTRHVCIHEGCDNVFEDSFVDALGHHYVVDKTATATCITGGKITYVCDVCGASYEITIEPSGHKYVVTEVTPTCVDKGYILHECSVCGDSYTEEFDALGHDCEDTVVQPTCTEQGYTHHVCKACGEEFDDAFVPAPGHQFVFDEEHSFAPEGANDGLSVSVCAECGAVYAEYLLGTVSVEHQHVWSVKEETPATCVSGGSLVLECDGCHETKTAALAKTGHDYVNGECSVCGAKTDMKLSYVPAGAKPVLDGKADEKAWVSAQTIDGARILWSDDGFYLAADDEVTVTIKESSAAQAYDVTVGGDDKEIFVPFRYYTDDADVWTWYGFVQERTQGDHEDFFGAYKTITPITVNIDGVDQEWKIRQAIKGSNGDYKVHTTKANDLMGTSLAINGKEVEYAGPYGQTLLINGSDEYGEITWWEDSQITGTSRADRELIAPDADFKVVDNFTGLDLYAIDLTEDLAYYADEGYYGIARTYTSDGKPLPRYGWLPAQPSYASYVSDAYAPAIDGCIDEVWETTAKLYHNNEIDDPLWSAYGYISVLWGDTGLYFLGSVQDTALAYSGTGMDDCVNFYVAETWGGKDAPSHYSYDKKDMSDYGEYFFGIDPVGRTLLSSDFLREDGTFAGTVWEDEKGYTVEAYVPYYKLGTEAAQIGHVMGIGSSVDDFRDPNGIGGRDEYTNLGGLSSYWSNPQSQFQMVFVGGLGEDNAPGSTDHVHSMTSNNDWYDADMGDVYVAYSMEESYCRYCGDCGTKQVVLDIVTNVNNDDYDDEEITMEYTLVNGQWVLTYEQTVHYLLTSCHVDASAKRSYNAGGFATKTDLDGNVIGTCVISTSYEGDAYCNGTVTYSWSDGTVETEVIEGEHRSASSVRTYDNPELGCEGGVTYEIYCADCGALINRIHRYEHSYVGHMTSLTPYGAPEDAGLMIGICDCGDERVDGVWGTYTLETIEHTEDGSEVTLLRFENGYTVTMTRTWIAEDGCYGHYQVSYDFGTDADGQRFVFSYDESSEENHRCETTYELVNGEGSSCEDGYYEMTVCTVCGEILDQKVFYYFGHPFIRLGNEYDLTPYGAENGTIVYEYKCPCGEYHGFDTEWDGCDFDWSWDEENGCQVYTCRDCGYFFTVREEMVDDGNCFCHRHYEYDFGQNAQGEELILGTDGVSFANHCYREVPYAFEKEGNTSCQEGILVHQVCENCGAVEEGSERTVYWHYLVNEIEYDLSEYGSECGQRIFYHECFCGQNKGIGWYADDGCDFEWSWDSENDCEIATCRNCGYSYTRKSDWVDEGNCFGHSHEEYNLGTNAKGAPLIIVFDRASEEHHNYHSVPYAFANEGSTSCEDGVLVHSICQGCGAIQEGSEWTVDWHYSVNEIDYDLSEYGSECGQRIIYHECFCGQNKRIGWYAGNECDFEQSWDEENGCDVYTCRNCGYSYTRKYDWFDEGNCFGHSHEEYNFGTNAKGESLIIVFDGESREQHQYREVPYAFEKEGNTSCGDGILVRRVCENCGAVDEGYERTVYRHCNTTEIKYDLSEYGSTCGQLISYHECFCGQNKGINRYGDGCEFDGSWDEENDCQVYTCRNCGYSYTYKNTWIDEGNCAGHWHEEYDFGTNAKGESLVIVFDGEGREQHQYRDVPYAFEKEGNTSCEDGILVRRVCENCGAVDEGYERTVYWHYDMTDDEYDLSEYGACGCRWKLRSCLCGAETAGYWESYACAIRDDYSVYTNEEGQVVHVETQTCEKCGLRIQTSYTEEQDPDNACVMLRFCTTVITVGDTAVARVDYTGKRMHHEYETTATLLPGATTCEDGVLVSRICKNCGHSEEYTTSWHETYPVETYDLSKYGSVCGGSMLLMTCACGERKEMMFKDFACNCNGVAVEPFLEGTLTTSVEQPTTYGQNTCLYCNYSRYTCAVTDPVACGFSYVEAHYWKPVENKCLAEEWCTYLLGFDPETNTAMETVSFKTGLILPYHDYEVDETNEDGHRVKTYTCKACGSTAVVEEIRSEFGLVEKRACTVTDLSDNGMDRRLISVDLYQVVEHPNGAGASSRLIFSRVERERADGSVFWEQNENEYESEHSCNYTYSYTNSDGDTGMKIGVNHYYHGRNDPGFEACTQGAYYQYCPFCGETFEKTGFGHDWHYDSEVGAYRCGRCGLTNENGADGAIILQDLTGMYGNGENYVIGYHQDDSTQYIQSISLVLHTPNEAGEDEIFLPEVTAWFREKLPCAWYISKADVQAAAEALGYSSEDYDVRMTFVPYGGDGTLDYAITLTK